jgi:hypothetical protein
MQLITLTKSSIIHLLLLERQLSKSEPLQQDDRTFLVQLLRQILEIEFFAESNIAIADIFNIDFCDSKKIHKNLKDWATLFSNIPGWDDAAFFYMVEEKCLLEKGVIAIGNFAPSMSYNLISNNPSYEIRFKQDSSAIFWFPTQNDADKYPELATFNGSWLDAYFAMLETMKKGWPIEEFPEELQQFFKKE